MKVRSLSVSKSAGTFSLRTETFIEISADFERYVFTKGYKTGNGTMYQKVVHRFLHWLEANNQTGIASIHSDTLEAYFNYLVARPGMRGQHALSQITINHHLFALRLLTDFLWETNRIDYLVVIPPNQKVKKANGTVISREQIAGLFELTIDEKERAILSLAYGCGLRSQEICDLLFSDISFVRSHVLVRHGKGNKTREVPMSDFVQRNLREYMDSVLRTGIVYKNEPSYLIRRPSGKPMHNNYLNIFLKKIVRRSDSSGIQKLDFSLHDLRHSIATHLAENGAGIEFIRDFLGHDSIDTSSLYMIRRKRRNRFIA